LKLRDFEGDYVSDIALSTRHFLSWFNEIFEPRHMTA
jgi:hypothetical protein